MLQKTAPPFLNQQLGNLDHVFHPQRLYTMEPSHFFAQVIPLLESIPTGNSITLLKRNHFDGLPEAYKL